MKNLLHFIVRFHFTIIFVVIEIFCMLLLVSYNNYQKTEYLNSSNALTGSLYEKVSSTTDYLALAETNEELNKENTRLKNILAESYKMSVDSSVLYNDSLYQQQYLYRTAKIINNSVNKQLNYITLNKGRLNGIQPEMAVVTDHGVVGVVKSVSNNFSTVISLLNSRISVSAKIKKNNYFGSLSWDGRDYKSARLYEVPIHVLIQTGDTIVTSGYSSIFPEGILLGTVQEILPSSGGNFHELVIAFSNDFKSLSYVKVIGDLMKTERLELEKEVVE
ncbi:rod shape-determining protein MreC [Labilibaculum manganireducens]|uniref:Cell shape-determining protein MreC n=1 Tax=Labilibaculum manganireducens TaxID=1940525 RepID=A0A2N3I050_9BACT|nr:rod shape-determining protein MreC [Labilibaculum manganireducens]PKQ63700.1 rod shape-determining protein MreC [Labilibaculum manganireducens]